MLESCDNRRRKTLTKLNWYTYEDKRRGPAPGLRAGSLVTFLARPLCGPSPRADSAPFGADALQGEEPG